jgi:hypothetical protein
MGFREPDIDSAYSAIRKSLIEIHSPHNDGWTSRSCKHELYLLKLWLEDRYQELPTFAGEDEWEQQRLIEVLKR